MPLEVPTEQQIERRIWLRALGKNIPITDLTRASVARMLFADMIIPELIELWTGLARATERWFIQTATGEDLDRRLRDFGFEREQARPAVGQVRITVDQDVVIPAGTVLQTQPSAGEPKRYTVDANPDSDDGSWTVTAAAGGAVLPVTAASTGVAGNTAAGTVTALQNPIAGVVSVTNDLPIGGGKDRATDAEAREAFRLWLLSLTRGTRAALMRGVLDYVDPSTGAKPVHSVAVVEWGGQTLLDSGGQPVACQLYIEDGSGSASAALVAAIQSLVDGDDSEGSGLRAAGVPVQVLSAQPLPVSVDVAVDVSSGVDAEAVREEVAAAVEQYVNGLPVAGVSITGELRGQVSYAQLFRRVMDVAGVLAARFGRPTQDVAVPVGMKAVPGEIAVTARVA